MTKVINAVTHTSSVEDAAKNLEAFEAMKAHVTKILSDAGVGEEKLDPTNAGLIAHYITSGNTVLETFEGIPYIKLDQMATAMGRMFKYSAGEVTDGSHTFNELYDHRCTLFLCLMSIIGHDLDSNPYGVKSVWHSRFHDDGTGFDDYTVVGIETTYGQTTYHVPDLPYGNYLRKTFPLLQLDRAPKWDGHTSNDVLLRLATAFLGQSLWSTEKKEVSTSES